MAEVNDSISTCELQDYTCTFSIINGSALLAIGILGTLLSSFSIYCLIYHVKLPSFQNTFILNIAAGDLLIAVVAIVRGLGILNPYFVGFDKATGTRNWWCTGFTFIANTVWLSSFLVLIPLTLDRFIAIIFTDFYRDIVSKRSSKVIALISWLPLPLILILDAVTLSNDNNGLKYKVDYYRCVYYTSRNWKGIFYAYTVIPFFSLVLMYFAMLFVVCKARINFRKLLGVSSLILITSLVIYAPDQFYAVFKVHMSYEVSNVLTITLWYTNSIWNPLIYFYSNPLTRKELAGTMLGKKFLSRDATTRTSATTSNTRDSSTTAGQRGNIPLVTQTATKL